MLILCGRSIPIEICHKVQDYSSDLDVVHKKNVYMQIFCDIKKVTRYMNFYNLRESITTNKRIDTIKWLTQYISICKKLHL